MLGGKCSLAWVPGPPRLDELLVERAALWARVWARQEARFSGTQNLSQRPYQSIHIHSTKNTNNIYLLHGIEWSGVPGGTWEIQLGDRQGWESS